MFGAVLTMGRLIPAHAGSTRDRTRLLPARPAHPRSRGEHFANEFAASAAFGSSPLTRGALLHQRRDVAAHRLIPAHAGSTPSLRCSREAASAHPRSRGEHRAAVWPRHEIAGSSPLTRGALDLAHCHPARCRLIPAHAGSTDPRGGARAARGAHPRSRGEHEPKVSLLAHTMGSSPLTRGAPLP